MHSFGLIQHMKNSWSKLQKGNNIAIQLTWKRVSVLINRAILTTYRAKGTKLTKFIFTRLLSLQPKIISVPIIFWTVWTLQVFDAAWRKHLRFDLFLSLLVLILLLSFFPQMLPNSSSFSSSFFSYFILPPPLSSIPQPCRYTTSILTF
jgi:hypothetical protein